MKMPVGDNHKGYYQKNQETYKIHKESENICQGTRVGMFPKRQIAICDGRKTKSGRNDPPKQQVEILNTPVRNLSSSSKGNDVELSTANDGKSLNSRSKLRTGQKKNLSMIKRIVKAERQIRDSIALCAEGSEGKLVGHFNNLALDFTAEKASHLCLLRKTASDNCHEVKKSETNADEFNDHSEETENVYKQLVLGMSIKQDDCCDVTRNGAEIVTATKGNLFMPEHVKLKIMNDREINAYIRCTHPHSPPNSIFIRNYVKNIIDKELDDKVCELLLNLSAFQKRIYHNDRLNYKRKRRFILGLKSIIKNAHLNRVKLVIVAPNLEPNVTPGGLDDLVGKLLQMCKDKNIPCGFALSRNKFKRALNCLTMRHSAVGILNPEGAEKIFNELLEIIQRKSIEKT